MKTGNAIRLCRTQRGVSQGLLAEFIGISVSYLSLVERGKRDLKISTLEAVAKALDVPLFFLVFLAETEEEHQVLPDELREKLSHKALQIIS